MSPGGRLQNESERRFTIMLPVKSSIFGVTHREFPPFSGKPKDHIGGSISRYVCVVLPLNQSVALFFVSYDLIGFIHSLLLISYTEVSLLLVVPSPKNEPFHHRTSCSRFYIPPHFTIYVSAKLWSRNDLHTNKLSLYSLN